MDNDFETVLELFQASPSVETYSNESEPEKVQSLSGFIKTLK